jgi:Tfp pilus assembly protein PilN
LFTSTVAFAKSQIRLPGLKLDKVLLCGGGARLDGMARWLSGALGVRVELFDPVRTLDLSKLESEAADALKRQSLESVVALGLAATAAADDAWSLEILPAAWARQRQFRTRTAWMIAAGALAAIFLGAAFWSTREDMVDAADRAAKLERDYKSANNVHRRTEDLVAKNTQLEKVATELMSLKGAGEQVARSVDQLRAHLPAEFWLTRLSSDLRADPELGVARGAEKPILSVEGRAREGTNALNTQYEAFVQNLRSGLPSSAAMRERLTPNGSRFTIDICLLGARGAESSNEAKVAR